MKAFKLALCAAVASLSVTSVASAQDAPEFSFNLGATTDYVFRGVSQTDEDPAIQGGVDVTSGMFYGGLWASNVDFGDDTSAEYDIYAGVTPTLGPVSADFGVIYYGYADKPDDPEYAYWEIKASGEIPAGPATIGASVYYSPDFFGETGEAWYEEVSVSVAANDKLSVGGAVGHQSIQDADDYTTWNFGVSYAFTDHISADLRYHDTDIDECDICDERVVASVSTSFP